MSMFVSAIIFIPLLAVAIAHFIWSLGGTWPLRSKELLMKTVYGRPGAQRMPPRLLTFIVAVLILTAGTIALALADKTGGGIWLTLAGAVLAMIFIARGVIGYTAGWRAVFREEPFATLDRRNYSPLALIIGAGYLILVLLRLI
jgi:hypothetical protein